MAIQDSEFIGKVFPQSQNEFALVLRKTEEKDKWGTFLYEIEYQKYKYRDKKVKSNIIQGNCLNPRIEIEEFVNVIWKQNCGDSVKVLEKITEGPNKGKWKIQFQNIFYEDIRSKYEIIHGTCVNPLIEQNDFIGHIFPQHCGDSVLVLRKTEEKCKRKDYYKGEEFLFEVEFINYPYKYKKTKGEILKGRCVNPNLPYKSKEGILNFIQNNFKDKKPTLVELAEKIHLSRQHLGQQIIKFKLQNYINHAPTYEQDSLLKYIKSICNEEIIEYIGKKENHYRDIDIFFPKYNFGIEFNGSYWHQEGINREFNYHKNKFKLYLKQGIIIFNIWDYFWFEDKNHKIIREEAKIYVKDIIDAFVNYKNILKLPQLI